MKVFIPSPLLSYTQVSEVEISGKTIRDILSVLESKYPGIRFRMVDEQDRFRPHIRLFLGNQIVNSLDVSVGKAQDLHIICALSGG